MGGNVFIHVENVAKLKDIYIYIKVDVIIVNVCAYEGNLYYRKEPRLIFSMID